MAAAVRPQIPEPARCWIRWTPRSWPVPAEPWVHLADLRLGEVEARAAAEAAAASLVPSDPPPPASQATDRANFSLPGPPPPTPGSETAERAGLALPGPPLDDVLYLPPVPASRATERDALARERLADGTPVLLQALAGEEPPDAPGATVVWDPVAALLVNDLGRLAALPPGSLAVWPLLPGLTDDPDLWRQGCERLAGAGATCVQALAPRLTPADRRRLLAQADESAFEALFHGEPPAERPFARLAHALDLAPFLPRPLPRPPLTGSEARRLAGALALIGELWLRLGRPVSLGQSFFAAARGADRTGYDLLALAREGNLGVLGWLDPVSRGVVEEWERTGASPLLTELLAEYLT